MDKLQYDSLYKFLVSLGLIMIVLPIAILAYLLNSKLILISQDEFESLSQLSQQMITNRDKLLTFLKCIFPWFAGLFILIGVGLLIYGLLKWKTVQKNLDKKLDAETTLQSLNVLRMSPKEINDRIESESSKSGYCDINNKNDEIKSEISQSSHCTVRDKSDETPPQSKSNYLNIYRTFEKFEKKCFDYVVSKYGRNYHFEKNIRIGNYEYDFIGVSKNNSIDLLIEVRYLKNISALMHTLPKFSYRIFEAGTAYETIMHRNFKCIIIIITPKNQLQNAETLIKKSSNNLIHEYNGKMVLQCIPEEDI